MDIADSIESRKDSKHTEPVRKTLFFVQDINRYMPSTTSGFTRLRDRMWCYEKLIELERGLRERDDIAGGQIRIADFLRNGSKSIIMTNKNLAVYLDHKNGGSVFELDFRRRRLNVCAGYNPSRHALPMVIEPGLSYTLFVDRFVETSRRRNSTGPRAPASSGISFRAPTITRSRRQKRASRPRCTGRARSCRATKTARFPWKRCWALKKTTPRSRLSTSSPTTPYPYMFRLAIELTFSLPGIADNTAYLVHGKHKRAALKDGLVELPQAAQWLLCDPACGVMIHCTLQKPVDVWCYPAVPPGVDPQQAEAVTIVLTAPVTLDGSGMWSLLGKLQFRRMALSRKPTDEI